MSRFFMENAVATKLKDELGLYFDADRLLTDPKLKLLPLEVVGFLAQLFPLLKDSPRLGYLCDLNDTALPLSSASLALLLGRPQDVVDRVLEVLTRASLLARNTEGILYDQEMVSIYELRCMRKTVGARGGGRHRDKILLDQKSRSRSSKTQEELNINSSSFPEPENSQAGGQCAQAGGAAGVQAGAQGAEKILLDQTVEQMVEQKPGDSVLLDQTVKQKGDPVLLDQTVKQTVKQIPDPGTPARAAAIDRLSTAWHKAVGARRAKDKAETLEQTFGDLFDAGIGEAAILAEITGTSTPRRKNRGEWPNQLAARMLGQLGHAPGSLAGTKELVPPASGEAERPFDTFHREFCACYSRVAPELVKFWEAGFVELKPPPTLEELRYALHCFVNDPRRKETQKGGKAWVGCFAENAGPILPGYIVQLRKMNARSGFVLATTEAGAKALPPAAERLETDIDCIALANAICERIGEARFNLWFVGKTRIDRDERGFVVHVANLFMRDWLRQTYAADFVAALASVGADPKEMVRVEINEALAEAMRAREGKRYPRGAGEREAKVG